MNGTASDIVGLTVPWLELVPVPGGNSNQFQCLTSDGRFAAHAGNPIILRVPMNHSRVAMILHWRSHQRALDNGTLDLQDVIATRTQSARRVELTMVLVCHVFFFGMAVVSAMTLSWLAGAIVLLVFLPIFFLAFTIERRALGDSDAMPVRYTSRGFVLANGELVPWTAINRYSRLSRIPRASDGSHARIYQTHREFLVRMGVRWARPEIDEQYRRSLRRLPWVALISMTIGVLVMEVCLYLFFVYLPDQPLLSSVYFDKSVVLVPAMALALIAFIIVAAHAATLERWVDRRIRAWRKRK